MHPPLTVAKGFENQREEARKSAPLPQTNGLRTIRAPEAD
jgi:hypothetical protein